MIRLTLLNGRMTVCVMCGCEVECAIGDVCEACLHDMNEESGAERVSLCMECDSETHQQAEHCHVCGSKHIIGINAPEGDGNDVSEYLSKKAVLKSIEEAYQTNLKSPYHTDWDKGFRSALRFVKRAVLSGAFDAEAERDKLIEGLRWYGKTSRYSFRRNGSVPILADGGQRAREILEEIGVTVE